MNKYLGVIILTLAFFFSCNENKFKIDVSDVQIKELKIKRFDLDLFKFNTDSSNFYIDYYTKTYGEFYNLVNYKILQFGNPQGLQYSRELAMFVKYWKLQEIDKILKKEFPSLNETEDELSQAFKHYKYYFPEKNIPEIYAFYSAFGLSVITSDSILAFATDKYLGEKYSQLYEKAAWSNYQQRRMTKEMIVVDAMAAQAVADFPYFQDKATLLENMIYEGKLQYYLNCMLPQKSDTLKWRYTETQYKWTLKNEKNIWNYMAENKLLFSTDKIEIKKFVGDAPFTNPFSNKSAPRAGTYIGYRIIESYMDNNPDISLSNLMKNNDSRLILSKSKYNP